MNPAIAFVEAQRQALLVVGVVAVSVIVCWVLAWRGPRGAILVVAAAIYGAGALHEIVDQPLIHTPFFLQILEPALKNAEGLARVLRAIGFCGMILGIANLVRVQLARLAAGNGDIPSAGAATPAPAAGPAQACRRTGLWAALAWCLVLVTLLQLLPRSMAEIIVTPSFRTSTVVGNWRGGTLWADRAMTVDLGRVRVSPQYSRTVAVGVLMAQAAVIAIGCLLIASDFGPDWQRMAGLVRPRPMHLLAALVGGAGLLLVFIGGTGLLALVPGWQMTPALPINEPLACATCRGNRAVWPWPVVVVLSIVIPAICAELWFRAFIGRGLVERFGTVPGVLLTSGLFALAHIEPRQMIGAFILGVVLHMAFLASQSLVVPILLHAAATLAVVLTMRSAQNVAALIPPLAYVGAIGLVLVAGVMLYRTRVPATTAVRVA